MTHGTHCRELACQTFEVSGDFGPVGGHEDPVFQQRQFEVRGRVVVAVEVLDGRARSPLLDLIAVERLASSQRISRRDARTLPPSWDMREIEAPRSEARL